VLFQVSATGPCNLKHPLLFLGPLAPNGSRGSKEIQYACHDTTFS